MVNQAFIIIIAYRPRRRRRRRRRKIPGIGRYPMGPTMKVILSSRSLNVALLWGSIAMKT